MNYYDVIYETKSGRSMVATNIKAKTKKEAEKQVKDSMKKSTSFKKIKYSITL